MPILDEKDIEKIRNKENRSVTMHEDESQRNDEQYDMGPGTRTVAFGDETYNVANMTQQDQQVFKASF